MKSVNRHLERRRAELHIAQLVPADVQTHEDPPCENEPQAPSESGATAGPCAKVVAAIPPVELARKLAVALAAAGNGIDLMLLDTHQPGAVQLVALTSATAATQEIGLGCPGSEVRLVVMGAPASRFVQCSCRRVTNSFSADAADWPTATELAGSREAGGSHLYILISAVTCLAHCCRRVWLGRHRLVGLQCACLVEELGILTGYW